MMLPLAVLIVIASGSSSDVPRFDDVTSAVGLHAPDGGKLAAARVAVADLNRDGRPDLVVEREQVFLNVKDAAAPHGFRLARVADAGLAPPRNESAVDGVSIFVDLDGDQVPDAVTFRSVDAKRAAAEEATGSPPPHAWWQRGVGDGTFASPIPIRASAPATASAIAAGDIDHDGRCDLLIGNWYARYGASNEAFPLDLLRNTAGPDGTPLLQRVPLPEDREQFAEDRDAAGRPIYGALIAELLPCEQSQPPQLFALAYGRRASRLYARDTSGAWRDAAPDAQLDGDAQRSGEYPAWLKERAKSDPRFDRATEKPYRTHGNTFDAAIGDVNNDGRFDCFVAEITHAWAGPSSVRSRFLLNTPSVEGAVFTSPAAYSIDRIPSADDANGAQRWNQGDLFAELVDVDHDGRLDLFLASGDYPDPPPFDERLRLFRQRGAPAEQGRLLEDISGAAGLDHVGCAQIATADFDGDGRMDIVAGQSFTRFTPDMKAAAGGMPQLRLWLNRSRTDSSAPSIQLILESPAGTPYGATVRIRCATPGAPTAVQVRQLTGPGGHAGKQSETIIHVGLGSATHAESIEVTWPGGPAHPPRTTVLTDVAPGRHHIRMP